MQQDGNASVATIDRPLLPPNQGPFVFRLFVTGMSPLSLRAVAAIKSLCEQHLAGRYELVVTNLWEHPEMAREKDIIATPTLIKELPLPIRRLVGDLSKRDRLLTMLM